MIYEAQTPYSRIAPKAGPPGTMTFLDLYKGFNESDDLTEFIDQVRDAVRPSLNDSDHESNDSSCWFV